MVSSVPDPRHVAPALLSWSETRGRRDLPWQQDATPYRVWVSEVMLQQTQAGTVAPYYHRFMSSFPTVESLAEAELDEVLHIWTGLGYYSRARNLHRAARLVMRRHGGCTPTDIETLVSLPGIGRSTASAILALSCGQRHPILDGNARRVLARYFGVEGEPGRPSTERKLWELAEACTPHESVAQYTQAIMDLGATVCRRSRPACGECPLRGGCIARATGRQAELPARRRTRPRPHREAIALIVVRSDGAVLLEARPPEGLWGGLASLPMFDSAAAALAWCAWHAGHVEGQPVMLPPYPHAFTHFQLTLQPVLARVGVAREVPEGRLWYTGSERIGLSKPAVDLVQAASEHIAGTVGLPADPQPGSAADSLC
jgi:A/G-specific adenine glycosylase